MRGWVWMGYIVSVCPLENVQFPGYERTRRHGNVHDEGDGPRKDGPSDLVGSLTSSPS